MEKASRAKKTEEASTAPVTAETHQELKDSMDAVLDEIDSLLEENAQEFVESYVQRGGQ
jgi:ubiquitin-like protein Pup